MSLPETLPQRPSLADLTVLPGNTTRGRTPRPGEVWKQCVLCPNVVVEHVSFTSQCDAEARMRCLALFDDTGGDGCVDVCGSCLAAVVLWCLDNRPELLRD